MADHLAAIGVVAGDRIATRGLSAGGLLQAVVYTRAPGRWRAVRPAPLVTGAVHDPRVMVHEPAKWVARLRATARPGDGPVLFRVELGAGAHTGPAGRYAHLRYEAEVLAWVLAEPGVAAESGG